jgi:hypothetical protein
MRSGAILFTAMKIQEKVREIMLAGELSSAEKLDRLHALIPESGKIICAISVSKHAIARNES